MSLDSFLHGARADTRPSVFQSYQSEAIAEVHQSNTDHSYNQPVTNHKSHRMYSQVLDDMGPTSAAKDQQVAPGLLLNGIPMEHVQHILIGGLLGAAAITILRGK